ncbi:hypothetical protein HYALB_00009522 [Hymenoscyphus albidus]|uniref:SCD domain-containing protein n=1 Tax=Hymenoscyphus albidus TaxID=595503 RepID=A0A9N9LPT4_9HELO|nr:hypothetical protein HYALB_00009522 [Hymenoscyphus albidus]
MNNHRSPLMDISNNDGTSSPVATGERRKSGRAVRAPDKFQPDAPSSQAAQPSAKRKRGGKQVENGASANEDSELSDPPESEGEEEVRKPPKRGKNMKKPAAKKPKVVADVEEVEEVEEEIEEESEESEEPESAEEEEVRKPRRKAKAKTAKKLAPKSSKVNGTAHEEAPAMRLPNRSKKTVKRVVIADEATEGLYAEVFASGDSLDDVTSTWLDRYRNGAPAAMTEMVNLIIKCTGCKVQVTEDDINDADNVENKIGEITEEHLQEGVTDYPLISRSKTGHQLRAHLVYFFHMVIEAIHASGLLWESTIYDDIISWLVPMTSAGSRPFRHTATLLVMTINHTMCNVARKEIDNLARITRQREGEMRKNKPNKARLADFENKEKTTENHRDEVLQKIRENFDQGFVHRYRDVDPKIRVECVAAMGNWVLTLPEVFLEGGYLRYFGWLLSDEQAIVRQEVVKQLERIMKIGGNIDGMHNFIERFRPRMVEMAVQDSDAAVRSLMVAIMDMIQDKGLLEPNDIDVVGRLIFDSEPKVRKALVGFFAANMKDLYENKIEEIGGEEVIDEYLQIEDEENFDAPRPEWIRLKCLAEILQSYDVEDEEELPSQIPQAKFLDVTGSKSRFTLAAQALYDKIPDLREWEVLAGYLLFDHSSEATGNETERALMELFKPNEKEEFILLEILNATVKLSLVQSEEGDRHKKKNSRNENAESRETAARHLASVIPRLLKKYGADPKTATVVLRLEHVLNLGVFQELRQDSTAYANLLDEISAQFNGHADINVLTEAGAALLHARAFEELEEVTEAKMQSLWETTTLSLEQVNKTTQIAVRGNLKKKRLEELSHILARLEQLASISNCVEPLEARLGDSDTCPITILLDIVARGTFEDSNDEVLDDLEDQVIISAIRSAMFYFMWKVREITSQISSNVDIPTTEIDQLKEWQEVFVNNLVAAFSSRGSLDTVRLMGTGAVLDVYVLFSTLRDSADAHAPLQELLDEISEPVQLELTSIFVALEKQHAKKSRKKLEDPADDEEPEDDDSDNEAEDDEGLSEHEKQSEVLRAEKQLCELTGKLVLGIIAKVIDASGELKGKLRQRLQRNKLRLGPNFKDVLGYLESPDNPKASKSHKSKAQQAAIAARKAGATKSDERVTNEDEDDPIEDDDDPFADVEPEEGTVEDLRRRELLDNDPDESVEGHENENGNGEPVPEGDEDEDEIMGD